MKTEFRNRALLPVAIPLAIVGTIALLVGSFALILLYNTRFTAIVLAIVAAAGILVAMSLATSRDHLDARAKGAVALAGATPLIIGLLVAVGVVGNLASDDLNINRKPHEAQYISGSIPDAAPVIATTSINSFCLPTGDGGCDDTNEWSFAYDGGELQYGFDNRNEGVQHNLHLYAIDDLANKDLPLGDAALSEDVIITPGVPPGITGPATQGFQFEPAEQLPEQLYFVCTIHPSTMYGILTLTGS